MLQLLLEVILGAANTEDMLALIKEEGFAICFAIKLEAADLARAIVGGLVRGFHPWELFIECLVEVNSKFISHG